MSTSSGDSHDLESPGMDECTVIHTRWFRYECESNQQPIRFNFDVEFYGPSYLTVRSSLCIILIWDPSVSDLYDLCQTGSSYLRWKPNQCAFRFNEQITRTHFLLLQPSIRPVPAQVILLWKGPPKLCIEWYLGPLWASPPKSPGGSTNKNLFHLPNSIDQPSHRAKCKEINENAVNMVMHDTEGWRHWPSTDLQTLLTSSIVLVLADDFLNDLIWLEDFGRLWNIAHHQHISNI